MIVLVRRQRETEGTARARSSDRRGGQWPAVDGGSVDRCVFNLNGKGSLTPSCTALKAVNREALVPRSRGSANASFYLSRLFSFFRYHCATRKLDTRVMMQASMLDRVVKRGAYSAVRLGI